MMKKTNIIVWGIAMLGTAFVFSSCRKGCTDPTALNYEENAKKDDNSCEYPETTFKLDIVPTFNGENLELNKDYINITGDRLQFTELKLIIANVTIGNQLITDAAYYDIKKGNSMVLSNDIISPGDYQGLDFIIGVDAARNNGDPSAYDPEHPLSINTAGNMHWSWNTGYIFYKIEGRYDSLNTQGSGTPNDLFLYHLGMNEYRKNWSNPNVNFSIKEREENTISLELDIAKLFYDESDTIYISNGEDFTHTGPNQEPLNIKLSNLFPQTLSVKE